MTLSTHSTMASFRHSLAASSPSAVERKREHFNNADVLYDFVTNSHGEKVRTFVTRPKAATGKVPVIFFVGWLSCDSVEYPDGETDGFGAIFWRTIENSSYATMRVDKPGVGESQGNCAELDYQHELDSYRAAFRSLRKYGFIDMGSVVVVGISNGGGFSPQVPQDAPVRGYVAISSWGRTWYEHMLELERRRMMSDSKLTPAEITDAVKNFAEFYSLFLVHRLSPGQVLAQHPEWKTLWYDKPEGQYGRPAAFYQQLQALNLGEVWQNVAAPVRVIRGVSDNIMSHADSYAIVETVNRVHPGNAQFLEVPEANHLLEKGGTLDDSLVPTMLTWIKNILATK
jgi:hypothetical protein